MPPPGLTKKSTLHNIIMSVIPYLGTNVLMKDLDIFPYQVFFEENELRNVDRLGGSLFHLKNEFDSQLREFPLNSLAKDHSSFSVT